MLFDLRELSCLPFFEMVNLCYRKDDISRKLTKKFLLPSYFDNDFAKVYLSWNEKGILIFFDVKAATSPLFYSDYRKGSSIEIFIDTRDRKDRSFLSQFCHHFLIFPKKENQIQAKEITRFRGEDIHLLCNFEDIEIINHSIGINNYQISVFLPQQCLHGYDVSSFRRFGFTYRINRFENEPQYFVVSSDEFSVEQNPGLWCSFIMKEG